MSPQKLGEFVRDFESRAHNAVTNVGARVGADDLRFEAAVIGQCDLDLVGILDHVMVGEDIAAFCINDDAGARTRDFLCATATATAPGVWQAEESPKRVIAKRVATCDGLTDSDIHNGR